MKLLVCSFYDSAARAFARPFYCPTREMALRIARGVVNEPAEDNLVFKHYRDFQLYVLGEFDDQNGLLVPLTPPDMISLCSALRDENREVPPGQIAFPA